MRADFKVVLDACVLANFSVCDVLLCLAETPRLFLPRWSAKILEETRRTQVQRLNWTPERAERFQSALLQAFPESVVTGYEPIVEACCNDPKDRHVLACAIRCQAEMIVTFNLKDFKSEALASWGIRAQHPQDYLLAMYSMDTPIVLHKLETIARKKKMEFEDYLIQLGRSLPSFSQRLLQDISRP